MPSCPCSLWLCCRSPSCWRFSQLAVGAAAGYLLLLPLQLSAASPRPRPEPRNAERNASLQRLRGPVLGPANLVHPLPLLKSQMSALFDQALAQINGDRAALPPASQRAALLLLLVNSLACLLLAVACAGFARRSGSRHLLLVEGKRLLQRLTGGQAGTCLHADAFR